MILFASYGRVGSKWLQDSESSYQWQIRRARALIEPHGGCGARKPGFAA